jgi:hypothetical protein
VDATEDFTRLPSYIEHLHAEGVPPLYEHFMQPLITELTTTGPKNEFLRIFIGPHTTREQFIESVPFVALDSCHLDNCFGCTLKLAVGRNSNRETYLMAWQIDEGENDLSWDAFIVNLIKTVPDLATEKIKGWEICCVSDRNPSLLKAIEKRLPWCTDVYCCFHLKENLLSKTKGLSRSAVESAFWQFPYAANEYEYKRAIQNLQFIAGEVS